MKIVFSETAWSEYVQWQSEDKKTLRCINKLIKDIQRNGLLNGIGKPEILKGFSIYSRRIDEQNRLLYTFIGPDSIEVISCKGHYDNI